jgi:hypothetical protein
VHPGHAAVKRIEADVRADQPGLSACIDPVADGGDTKGAGGGAVGVGSFEVDGRELQAGDRSMPPTALHPLVHDDENRDCQENGDEEDGSAGKGNRQESRKQGEAGEGYRRDRCAARCSALHSEQHDAPP